MGELAALAGLVDGDTGLMLDRMLFSEEGEKERLVSVAAELPEAFQVASVEVCFSKALS